MSHPRTVWLVSARRDDAETDPGRRPASLILESTISTSTLAGKNLMKTPLTPYNVTIRVFDPTKGAESGQDYVLPVDSPDAEHAAASTMANAVSFTTKTEHGKPLPVAFTCLSVEPR